MSEVLEGLARFVFKNMFDIKKQHRVNTETLAQGLLRYNLKQLKKTIFGAISY